MRFEKWLGYEFASNFECTRFPEIKFENGIIESTVSGYLLDVCRSSGRCYYIVELRYKDSNYDTCVKIVNFTYSDFKHTFYDCTVLPR